MPPDSPTRGPKNFLAPAQLEKYFGPQPPGFGFNQVGKSEYKGLLSWYIQLSRSIQDIALFDTVFVL